MITILKTIITNMVFFSLLFSSDKTEPFYEYKKDKNYRIEKINTDAPPIIDGNLNDIVWEKALIISDFIQLDPNIFKDPKYKTDVKMLYDDENIYIYAKLYYLDENNISKALCRRDDWMECFEKSSDWFVFDVDTDHSHQNGYVFGINASGVQIDALILNDLDYDSSWDGIWTSKVLIDDKALNIEFKIPIFNFTTFNNQEWGVNFTRYTKHLDETSSWVVIPNYIDAIASKFGHIYNLKFENTSKKIYFKPYISQKNNNINDIELRLDTLNQQSYINNDLNIIKFDSGFDFKYKLFSNGLINTTINPDFGQVELDPEEINLTAYESFYSENRDFFLDNSSIFDLPIKLFHSRRIGGNNDLLMASKIVLKNTDNFIFGNIFAIESERLININRIEKEYFNSNSFAGLTSTILTKNDTIIKSASIDAVLNLFDNKISVDGQFILSDNQNKLGNGLSLETQYISPNLKYFLDFEYFDKQLDINDLGFLNRNNFKSLTNGLILRELNTSDYFRSKSIFIKNTYQENIDKIKLKNDLAIGGHIKLINYLNFSFENIYSQKHFDDYLTYDFEYKDFGPTIEVPSSNIISFMFKTNPLKKVYLETEFSLLNSINHNWEKEDENKLYNINLILKPVNFITSKITYENYIIDESLYFVETIIDEIDDKKHYIFSERKGYRDIFSIRLDASLNLKSSIQLYAEYYSNSFNFYNYRVIHQNESTYPILDPGFFNGDDIYDALYFDGEDADANGSYLDPNDDPLFYSNYNNLNMNAIFKWEYKNGANIYFIWTYQKGVNGQKFQNIKDLIRYNYSKNYNEVYEDNTFLIKVDYWFNI